MWRRAVRVVRVIRVAPGHNITPELRSDDNIIYTKAYSMSMAADVCSCIIRITHGFFWLLLSANGCS